MRLRSIVFILSTMICLCLSAKVWTLSICIGEYPSESGWNSLGADNDARLIRQIFDEATVVTNEKATYNQILSELNTLNRNANRGDTIIIHFSGHGQQILGGASSKEVDLVDEALVPYDAVKKKSVSYSGQSHITDDLFGEYISGLRKSVGPNGLVIAVIDACHSNSMDKDADATEDVYRGTDEIFGAEALSPDSIEKLRESYNSPDETSVLMSPELSDAIFISACETHKRNYEIKVDDTSYGSLTYYFCKAFEAKGISDLNEFLSDLYTEMSTDKTMKFHGQTPVIRNTIGWEAPKTKPFEPTDPRPNNDISGVHESYWWWAVCGIVVIILIILVICRKKKK